MKCQELFKMWGYSSKLNNNNNMPHFLRSKGIKTIYLYIYRACHQVMFYCSMMFHYNVNEMLEEFNFVYIDQSKVKLVLLLILLKVTKPTVNIEGLLYID